MRITDQISRRLSALSFVSACLIVYYHVPMLVGDCAINTFVLHWIRFGLCELAVPFFFFASGYLLMAKYDGEPRISEAYVKAVRKRIRTLLVPFAIFNTIAFFLKNVAAGTWRGITVGSVVSAYGLNPFEHPVYHLLWYIVALYILVLLSPLLACLINKSRSGAIALIAGAFGLKLGVSIWMQHAGASVAVRHLFSNTFCLTGLLLFVTGMSFAKWDFSFTKKPWVAVVLLILGFLLVGCPCLDSVHWNVTGTVMFIVGLWNIFPALRFPDTFVRNSFSLYLIHGIVLYGWRLISRVNETANVLQWLGIGVGTIIISLVSAEILRRLFPKIASVAFGGR